MIKLIKSFSHEKDFTACDASFLRIEGSAETRQLECKNIIGTTKKRGRKSGLSIFCFSSEVREAVYLHCFMEGSLDDLKLLFACKPVEVYRVA